MFFEQYFSYIVALGFIWRIQENPEKTTELQQVTDKLYHINLYQVHFAKLPKEKKQKNKQ
jgi:hypothetical protein